MLVIGTYIVWSKGLYPTVPTPGVAFCVILCDLFLLQRLELLPPCNPVLFNLGQATRKGEILLQAAKADMSSKEKLWLFVKRGKLMQDSVACDCLTLSWYSTVLHIHLLNAWLAWAYIEAVLQTATHVHWLQSRACWFWGWPAQKHQT